MELINFDLDSWVAGVKDLQKKYRIYPAWHWPKDESNEIMWRSVAFLLNSLWGEISNESKNLKKDFFLLAREHFLYCDPIEAQKDFIDIPFGYYERFWGDDNEDCQELIKITRLALDLTLKTIDEVPGGFDSAYFIDFCKFLYRHCPTGYLNLSIYWNPHTMLGPYFFDRKKNFVDVAQFISSYYQRPKEDRPIGFTFSKSLFSRPIEALENMQNLPCLFSRVNSILPDLEDRFSRFGIFPSIRMYVYPQQVHFYWILENPVDYGEFSHVIDLQLKIAKIIGGAVGRCGFSPISNIPGQFHYGTGTPHFISCKLSDLQYSLNYFDTLPELPETERYAAWESFLKGSSRTLEERLVQPNPGMYFPVIKLEDYK
jgi:hypothetical protein